MSEAHEYNITIPDGVSLELLHLAAQADYGHNELLQAATKLLLLAGAGKLYVLLEDGELGQIVLNSERQDSDA